MIADKKKLWISRIGQQVLATNYRGVAATGRLLEVVAGVWGYGGDAVALVLDVQDEQGSDHWPADKCQVSERIPSAEPEQPILLAGPSETPSSSIEPLFKERVPEAAARQVAVVLAWLTECQLATLEGMEAVNRTPKSELARQREICATAVKQCKELGVPAIGLRGDHCLRLEARMES